MKHELYEKIKLKDGRSATIVDTLGSDYIVDINNDGEYETEMIRETEIERI